MDFALFRGGPIDPSDLDSANIFVSAYNTSDRVLNTFQAVPAQQKAWMVHPEYDFTDLALPQDCLATRARREGDFIREALDEMRWVPEKSLVVDITGMMRPQLLCLLAYLEYRGANTVRFLYSEPIRYTKNENTQFSKGAITEVRQVDGYEGRHVPDTRNDLLIIGSGYDHELIGRVAESKDNAKKLQVFGLPALRPHMYQENVLRAAQAAESLGGGDDARRPQAFAPAYDPFATADVLADLVRSRNSLGNLYLCPLGTKAQTLGFGLFYLCERVGSASSIIFPFRERYSQETGKGVSRVWRYDVEFELVRAWRRWSTSAGSVG